MVLQLFLGILASVALFLPVSRRRRRLWPALMLPVLAIPSLLFLEKMMLLPVSDWSYHWAAYEGLNAQFTISSTAECALLLRFLLPVWGSLLYLNLICRREDYPLTAGNIAALSLAAFIFMFSARDFMQLMAGSCCFSILGFYLINENTARNKFIFYSFTSEMAVFAALAVVYAKSGNIALSALPSFVQNGWHKDLVALLLLTGILIKCGAFLFQNQLLDLQRLSFNRLLTGSLLLAPLSGLVLWFQLSPLLNASVYTLPVLHIIIVLSVICAVFGLLWNDNLKAKILYFNMLFFMLALFELSKDGGALSSFVMPMLPVILLVDWGLMIISVSASDEIRVSRMGGFIKHLKWNLLLVWIAVFAFVAGGLSLLSGWPAWLYLGAALLALAAVLHAVYLGKNCADDKVWALLKNVGFLYSWPVLAVAVLLIWPNVSAVALGAMGGFLLLWLFLPQKLANLFAENELVQNYDWLSDVYQLLIVAPLRLLGRILWLAVDFVVIERSIIGSISGVCEAVEHGLDRAQTVSKPGWWLMLGLGLCLLLINIGIYAYE